MRQPIFVAVFFIAATGCTSQTVDQSQPPAAATSTSVRQDLDTYSQTIVTATLGNILNPTPAEQTGEAPMLSYVIKFETSDPALMSEEDGDTNKVSYALNGALEAAWSRRFCTHQLKAIMAKHDVFLISGHLLNDRGEMQVFTPCML